MIVLRYWYLGPLKTKAAHFFSTLKVSAIYSVEICPVFLSLLCDVHIWIFKKFLAPDVCGVLQYYSGGYLLTYGRRKRSRLGKLPVTPHLPAHPPHRQTHIYFLLNVLVPFAGRSLTLAKQTLNKMTDSSSVICKGVYISIWK